MNLDIDKFQIMASGHAAEADRTWTRSSQMVTTFLADRAIALGYTKVIVKENNGVIHYYRNECGIPYHYRCSAN